MRIAGAMPTRRFVVQYRHMANVLITGASSGIGRALAIECARRGNTLFLCGRSRPRLDDAVRACRDLGARVYGEVLDVANAEAVRRWMQAADNAAPLDRVFSNAGVATGVESEENVRETFAVNVSGNVNVVLAAIDLFRRRRAADESAARQVPPHILVTASIAGYGPLKSCPSYSATKSCMKTWALALRGMLAAEGIRVSAICPGFVRSRITEKNTCPMPFFMEADKAARIILTRADRNVGLIAFPWPMRLASWALSILPFRLNELLNRLLPAKISAERQRILQP